MHKYAQRQETQNTDCEVKQHMLIKKVFSLFNRPTLQRLLLDSTESLSNGNKTYPSFLCTSFEEWIGQPLINYTMQKICGWEIIKVDDLTFLFLVRGLRKTEQWYSEYSRLWFSFIWTKEQAWDSNSREFNVVIAEKSFRLNYKVKLTSTSCHRGSLYESY